MPTNNMTKIEKYLRKELKYLMRETSILHDLKEDIWHIKFLLNRAKKNKKTEALLEHYENEAERVEKYSERIERRLNIWIKRLEKLITEEEKNLSEEERKHLEELKSHIEICRANLVKILAWEGDLHDLIKKRKNWKEVEVKINEALGDDEHPGINSLILLLRKLEKLEEWLRVVKDKITKIKGKFGVHYTDWKNFISILKHGFYKDTEVISIDNIKEAKEVWISTGTEEAKFKTDWKRDELSEEINKLKKDKEKLKKYLFDEIKFTLEEEPKSLDPVRGGKKLMRTEEKLFLGSLLKEPQKILENVEEVVEILSTLEGRKWHFSLHFASEPAAYNIGLLIDKKFIKSSYPSETETIIEGNIHEQLIGIMILGGSAVYKYIREKMFELTKNHPENRVPIYGSKGELLWPK